MSRDEFLANMMGLPWNGIYPKFSTSPYDILALQRFVLGAEWWERFWGWCYHEFCKAMVDDHFPRWVFSDPDRFATLVAEFRGYKPEGGTDER